MGSNGCQLLNKKRTEGLFSMVMCFGIVIAVIGGVLPSPSSGNTVSVCLNNTKDEADCKNCCDCLDNPLERKSCRDACIEKADFSGNSDFITVNPVIALGSDYPYTEAISLGDEGSCKTYCDESSSLSCGDRKYCRDACNAAFESGEVPADVSPAESSLVQDGAVLTLIQGGLGFAEGPAWAADGLLYFSDILNNIIYSWSEDLGLSVFRSDTGGANGLYIDSDGRILACEGSNHRLVSINPEDPASDIVVIASEYEDKPFNEPNDLWVAPNGNVYFTDPVYFSSETQQDGEHVYYLSPDKTTIVRVIDDMIRPNGLVGTPDGNTLYVTDHGAGKTYSYIINSDGTLSGKQLFVSVGGDGMTIDSEGNVYLCAPDGVRIYDVSGNAIETVAVPERPTNVCFGGITGKTLFITTQKALYCLSMNVGGAVNEGNEESESEETPNDSITEVIDDATSSCFMDTVLR